MDEHPFKEQLAKKGSYQEPDLSVLTPAAKPQSQPKNPFHGSIRRNQLKMGVLIVGVLALLFGGGIFYFIHTNQGQIIVEVDPKDTITISLNGRQVSGSKDSKGTHLSVYAGQYRLKVEKSDYLPFVQDILLNKGQTVTVRPGFAFQPKENKDETTSIDYVRPSKDQKSLFYLGNGRRTIYRMDISNRLQIPLTDRPLSGVKDIQWSGDPDVAIIPQATGTYLQEIPKYDFERQASIKVGGSEIISPIWDPNDPNRLAFGYTPASGERSMVFTDKTFSQLDRKIPDLGPINNPKLSWSPDSSFVILLSRSSNLNTNNIWVYTTADGSLKQLTQTGSILDAGFSPDSSHILYETQANASTNTSTLNVMNVDGSGQKSLNIHGKVAQAAWKDATSFFFPEQSTNALVLYGLDGSRKDMSFSLRDFPSVQGMFYFSASKTLIFYTSQTIYTVNLAIN